MWGLSSELKPRASPAGFPVLLVHLRGPARGARRINGAPQMRWCYLKRGRSRDGQISRMSRPRRLSLQTLPVALGVLAVSDGRTSGMGARINGAPKCVGAILKGVAPEMVKFRGCRVLGDFLSRRCRWPWGF